MVWTLQTGNEGVCAWVDFVINYLTHHKVKMWPRKVDGTQAIFSRSWKNCLCSIDFLQCHLGYLAINRAVWVFMRRARGSKEAPVARLWDRKYPRSTQQGIKSTVVPVRQANKVCETYRRGGHFSIDRTLRRFWWCGKPGHDKKRCPGKKREIRIPFQSKPWVTPVGPAAGLDIYLLVVHCKNVRVVIGSNGKGGRKMGKKESTKLNLDQLKEKLSAIKEPNTPWKNKLETIVLVRYARMTI